MNLPVQAQAPSALEPFASIVRSNEVHPTEEAYSDIILAFDWFNDRLFDGRLKAPILTFARKPGMLGAFGANRFESKFGERAHEIILNPQYLAQRGDYETLSTLVHEMAHQWREDFGPESPKGKRSGRGYHDEVWAACMEGLGLVPSDTGLPGGKRTGTRVSHFIVEGGPFDAAARELIGRNFLIRWHGRPVAPQGHGSGRAAGEGKAERAPDRGKDRIKFSCPSCQLNAWAKPSAKLKCAPCDAPLTPQDKKEA